MRVHHIDCCTMCPPARHHLNDPGHLVGHVLVVETDRDGLVLVDTGIGRECIGDVNGWMGRMTATMIRPVLDVTRTAHHQLDVLGYRPEDVRHIVLTHLDADHAGGIADFPEAEVHVHGAELDAAVNPTTSAEKQRYRRRLWAHDPRWRTFRTDEGDEWRGFGSARPLVGGDGREIEGLVTLGLPGHTRGHSLVAVDRGPDGWVVHAGDAYFHRAAVHGGAASPLLSLFERIVATDRSVLEENHARLRRLATDDDVTVVSAHDPDELAALAVTATVPVG